MRFTIKQVCAHLDVKPDTLRKWEARHGIVDPKRGENGYRYYTQEDLEALDRFVSARLGRTKAVDLRRGGDAPDDLLAVARKAARNLDDKSLEAAFDRGMRLMGLAGMFTRIWAPVLTEIGEYAVKERGAWIAREHLAVAMLRDRLAKYLEGRRKHSYEIALATPEGDLHELGLLVAAAALNEHKIGALYLGANLPLPALAAGVKEGRVKHLALTMTKKIQPKDFRAFLKRLKRRLPKDTTYYAAGRASLPLANVVRGEGVVFLGTDLAIAVEKVVHNLRA